jgi:hypothetical protein
MIVEVVIGELQVGARIEGLARKRVRNRVRLIQRRAPPLLST